MQYDEFMDLIMDHYEHPRNFGELDEYDLVQHGGNEGCGDTIKLYIKFSPDGSRVQDISFTGEGCIVSLASTSIILDKIKNEKVDSIYRYDLEKMKEYLGKDLVIRRPRCATLVIDTLKTAIKRHDRIKRNEELQRKTG